MSYKKFLALTVALIRDNASDEHDVATEGLDFFDFHFPYPIGKDRNGYLEAV